MCIVGGYVKSGTARDPPGTKASRGPKSGPVSGGPGPWVRQIPTALRPLFLLLLVVVIGVYEYLQVNSKMFVRIGGPTHPRPFTSHERTCGMRHSALAPARWECAMSSKAKRR